MTETKRPEPMVPPEVDLRDFAFMPLDVARLRDSGFIAEKEPEEIVAGIMCWSASWHQLPASSLPDNDKQLAKLAGYGRGVRDFLKVKEGALYNFVMCSDGRWYHPVVAEKAAEGWNGKLKEEHKRACDRQRKANKERAERQESPLPMPVFPPLLSLRLIDGIPCFRYWDSSGKEIDPNGNPKEGLRKSRLKGEGEGEGQREGQGQSLKPKAARADADPPAPPETPAHPPPSAGGEKQEVQATLRGAMSACLRSEGVKGCTPSHPTVVGWVQRGITVQLVREALDIAREKKPKPDAVPLAYLVPIVTQLLTKPTAGAAAPPRGEDSSCTEILDGGRVCGGDGVAKRGGKWKCRPHDNY
jgi:hypothetical protein